MENVIEVKNLSKTFGTKNNINKVLTDLSMEVKKGEFVSFDGITFPEPEYEIPVFYLDKEGDGGFRILNLTDTQFSTFYFVSIGHEFLQRGQGRTMGATLRIDI